MADEPAVVEDRDVVADALDVAEDVRREEDRGLPAERSDEREQVVPSLGVQRAHRLVEDQHRRPSQDCLRDAEPLAHPAGVAGDRPPRVRRQATRSSASSTVARSSASRSP